MIIRYGDKIAAMFWIILLSIFLWTTDPAAAQKGELAQEFHKFDIASPVVSVIRNSEDDFLHYGPVQHERRRLQFIAFEKTFDLELDLNVNLIPNGFKVSVVEGNKITTSWPKTENCQYRGKLKGSPGSVAAISICKDGIRGYIQDGMKEVYYVEPTESGSRQTVVVRDSDKISEAKNCGVDLDSSSQHSAANHSLVSSLSTVRTKRSIKPPSTSNADSLFVELVLVADTKVYERYQKNETRVTNRFIEIVSVVNALYTPLNIFVALTGVEIWSTVDKISITNDSEVTLKNFLRYRRKELAFRLPNDNAYLITFATFDGMVVGKALKGQMCTYEYSGGVAKDHSRMAGPVGATVAHEMGHNFGMEHDFTDCQCLDDRCIMTPASVGQTPSNWSSCSRKYLEDNLARGIGSCLKRVPQKVEGPNCGNGFLEDGEECDCGPEEFCHNKCCIAAACKLSVNATCGHGSCCDLDTCSPKKESVVCRERTSDECDLPEYCDGKVGTCPDDFWKDDGTTCRDGQAYCANGACRTHKDQCAYLWGSTGNVADDKCFELNVKGNANGNCGRDRVNENYTMCAVRDTRCGLLHCTSQVERLAIGAESATSVSQSFIPAKTTYISCRAAYVDFGMEVMDPGMVPNGAKCGQDMMCYNQLCTYISNVPRKCPAGSCSGHGVCNNLGHCHCDAGYGPPDCSYAGYGGSIDSGPANSSDSYRHLRNAMLVLFLLVLPVVVAVLLVYFMRHRIKKWLEMKKKHSRSTSRSKPAATKPAEKKNVQKISGGPSKNGGPQRQKSIRGVPISQPIALSSSNGTNDTVVAMNMGNGRLTNTYLNEAWPIERHTGPIYVNELAGTPPPLPAKPPKAVRDSSQVLHQLANKHSEPAVSFESFDGEEPSLKPIRPAPAPPPRPPTSQPVSRNSSSAGSSSRRRTRPSNRPPDPPTKANAEQAIPSQSEDDSSSDSSLMGRTRENPGENVPKNLLVSELTRKFESQRNGRVQ